MEAALISLRRVVDCLLEGVTRMLTMVWVEILVNNNLSPADKQCPR